MRYLLLAALLLSGCATLTGVRGPSDRVITAFCGTHERYIAEQDTARQRHDAGQSLRPTVGMSGCRVLAWYGMPNEQTTIDVGGGMVLNWTYWIPVGTRGPMPHLLTLRSGRDGRGVVSSVVWH